MHFNIYTSQLLSLQNLYNETTYTRHESNVALPRFDI